VGVERGDPQAPGGGVERDPGTGHAQAYDKQINDLAVR
jgi:hypothetical protein